MAAQITDSGAGANITGINLGFANNSNSGANWSLTNTNNTFTGTILHSATTYAGGTFSYASAGGTNAITFNQQTGTGGITYTGATDKTMSGLITANSLTTIGVNTGTITFSSTGAGAVNYSNTGSLGVGGGSGNKGLVLSGTNTGDNTFAGGWSNNTAGGAATLTKSGAGKWILTNTNGYTGATTISDGTLQLGNGGTTGALSTSSAISIASGATFAINQSDTVTQGTDFSSAIITGAGGFTQAGAGTTVLNLNNTYTGVTTITAGTLSVGTIGNGGVAGNLGQATAAATNLVFNGGTLQYTGANATNDRAFTINAGTTATINTANNISFAGATGAATNGDLTKTGAGTLTLTGASTYTGATNVNGGTLLINGSTSSTSLVTVNTGATLGGSGTVGPLTIATGGTVAPGNSPGILNTGNYTQLGLYSAEINGLAAGTQHDQINVAGTVNITGGSLTTLFSGGSYALNNMIFILLNDGTDAITGTYSGFAQGAVVANHGGFDWQISYVANNTGIGTGTFTGGNDIVLMAVPEPSTALLTALGVLALLRRRRLAV
jgi:fibronectin-binding autotransporter adhesin